MNISKILAWVLGIAFVISLGFNIYFISQKDDLQRNNTIYRQNYVAAVDSLRNYKLENGNLLQARNAYILETEQLRTKLNISEENYKDMEKKLNSKIAAILKSHAQVTVDSIFINSNPTTMSDTIASPFAWSDEWLSITGRTIASPRFSRTTIYNVSADVPLTIGMTDDCQFFATTDNPHVIFTSITGALDDRLIPERKRWNIGVSAGIGVMYGLNSKKFEVGPGIMWSVGYTLFSF